MAEGEQVGEEKDAAQEAAEPTKKKKGIMGPLMIGLVLALLMGGGAAYAVMSGLVPLGDEAVAEKGDGDKMAKDKGKGEKEAGEKKEPPVFVAFDPLTITLTHGGAPRQLRLALSIETSKEYSEKVELMKPRMLDALNTLLRAMNERELTEPSGLDRLRAQMLRRVRIAADPTAVKDLLVTEFVVF